MVVQSGAMSIESGNSENSFSWCDIDKNESLAKSSTESAMRANSSVSSCFEDYSDLIKMNMLTAL